MYVFCGPGSPGEACQQGQATWGGVQKSGGLGLESMPRGHEGLPHRHLLPEDSDSGPSVLCSWCLLRGTGVSRDTRVQGPWPVHVLLRPRLS